jgi:hypothetical protein
MLEAPENLPEKAADLRVLLASREVEIIGFKAELRSRDLLIEKLKHQLAGLRRDKFGSSSEALDQLELSLEEEEIARDGNHSAVLVVYKTDGSERVVHFAEGELAYVEISEVEAGNTPHGAVSAGTISVTFVGEYYEVPQNVVLGQVE